MTHGRKPRRPRDVRPPFRTAMLRASRLTEEERGSIMNPVRACLKALREGVATELQHDVLHTTMQISLAIERAGVVRGLGNHFNEAVDALDAIATRCRRGSTWLATALHFYELDAMATAVDLHDYQLQQLSFGELRAVINRVLATTRSSGGKVITATAEQLTALGVSSPGSMKETANARA
ncbi:hypothetical protein LJR118_000577 [Acidovorax sp. LjRoot118]|uniref:hypothetical protein n=1 Tax=Acidovorax sp. LjRoot118 TaxID=3342256 RepID=UPI003ECF4C49